MEFFSILKRSTGREAMCVGLQKDQISVPEKGNWNSQIENYLKGKLRFQKGDFWIICN